ncbi:hypothetical protein pEaSNUABM54_00104 [Erwinia phage pEa_SNUABM_54]|nr:hypothetical protein pEaSNUABM54_00104 [Erwinia phage pEa_SNUABM_54]
MMRLETFENILHRKRVDRVTEAVEFMDEFVRKGTDPEKLKEISYAFTTRYRNNIVVNGALVPAVAKSFKAQGYELSTVKVSGTICYATVNIHGDDVVVYRDERAARMLAKRYLDNKLSGYHPWVQKVLTPLISKLLG